MPHLGPWLCLWVAGTVSQRSGRYGSRSLDLQIATPGFTDQLSTLCWSLSSPGLATPISKSRPPDPKINPPQMLVVEFPGSGDSHLQVCPRRQAEELIESADPQSQKEPSNDSPFTDRNPNQNDGRSYGYGAGYSGFLTTCRIWSCICWCKYAIAVLQLCEVRTAPYTEPYRYGAILSSTNTTAHATATQSTSLAVYNCHWEAGSSPTRMLSRRGL